MAAAEAVGAPVGIEAGGFLATFEARNTRPDFPMGSGDGSGFGLSLAFIPLGSRAAQLMSQKDRISGGKAEVGQGVRPAFSGQCEFASAGRRGLEKPRAGNGREKV